MIVKVSAKEFQTFLSAINNVFRGGASLKIHKEYIDCIVTSEDNASIILYTKINILNDEDINLANNEEVIINVPDLSKFIKLLDMNDKDIFEFIIDNNYVYFKNDKIHGAKFILSDLPPQKINKRISVKWFNSFEKNFTCELNKTNIKEILHLSSFANDSDKVYFYQEADGSLIAELNDRNKTNIDTLSLVLTTGSGTMKKGAIVAVDSLSKLVLTDSIKMETSTIGEGARSVEVIFFTIETNNILVKYFFNSKLD